ncbi:peptidase M24 family protein [Salipaludibacillus neizhouensis]|uniref:Peptidase M24 family protein n=1 Tax=Salipaludibacillus neizhouensis TaxID=885475 RepID=A0A3A9K790_9BACI|nr:Xaa-Pro peptidase family protein [Salipaludibacillus neizhouensis]RKL66720.1 peptidase M24 family protein [Salipaludibacillus neizhouensis]
MNTRILELKDKMKHKKIDALMVQTRANVFYLTQFDTNPHERLVAVIIFQTSSPIMICPNMEVNQVKTVFTDGDIISYSDTENPWQKILEYFIDQNLQPTQFAIETSMSWARMNALESVIEDVKFQEADSLLHALRLVKDSKEIAILKEAAHFADEGVLAGINALREGVTEMEVLAAVEYSLKRIGIREMSFSTMVLFGENAGDPHGNPGDRQLKKGDAVLFDLGVMWKGYASDITRTVFFDHIKKEDEEIYNTVLEAQRRSLLACAPGNPISKLDSEARSFISKQGYGDYFPHRIGHGLGIEVHEFPSLSDQNTDSLKSGMVFTIEPGIYIPNQAGVRIEDDIIITEDGFEILTQFPKDLTIVPL